MGISVSKHLVTTRVCLCTGKGNNLREEKLPTGWVCMQGDERVGATNRLDGRAAGPQLAT